MKTIKPTWTKEQINRITIDDLIIARFAVVNKNDCLEEYKEECDKEQLEKFEDTFLHRWRDEKCVIKKIINVDYHTYKELSRDLLSNNERWEEIGGSIYIGENEYLFENIKDFSDIYKEKNKHIYKEFKNNNANCVVLVRSLDNAFVVNTEGYSYARYVGLFPTS